MNAHDLPRYELDEVGEYRLVCAQCEEPITEGTLCRGCESVCHRPPGECAGCGECDGAVYREVRP